MWQYDRSVHEHASPHGAPPRVSLALLAVDVFCCGHGSALRLRGQAAHEERHLGVVLHIVAVGWSPLAYQCRSPAW